MAPRFTDKIAAITGAASGIGRWTAHAMAQEGATVLLLDRDVAGLQETAEEIRQNGGLADFYQMDLADVASLPGVADAMEQKSGPIDILVNSAGISQLIPWSDITVSDWDRVMDVNLRGLFFLTQPIAARMVERRKGRIVNIASVGGKRGGALTMHYGASKAGVISITRSLSQVLAPHNVTVNAVCPGYVETALTEANDKLATAMGWQAGERTRQLIAKIPMQRLPDVGEVGAAALFLASDEAGYITGQSVNVDGGVVFD